MAEAGRRMPADRLATKFAIGDVERAIDQHGEAQSATCAKLQHPYAALDSIRQRHQAHASELRKQAGALVDLTLRQFLAEQFDHRGGVSLYKRGGAAFSRARRQPSDQRPIALNLPSRNFFARGTSSSERCS